MYDEDDLLPISAVSQFAYCPRRCALMLIEQAWDENTFTIDGTSFHERAHDADIEVRPGIRIYRGVAMRSLRLGLSGQADVVEFHPCHDSPPLAGVELPGVPGRWLPYPVEYKRGKPKPDTSDEVQVCAQALCLEEMLGADIPFGALYYGKPRRRTEVAIDAALRAETERIAEALHKLVQSAVTPSPVKTRKCNGCSLIERCFPRLDCKGPTASDYVQKLVSDICDGEDQ